MEANIYGRSNFYKDIPREPQLWELPFMQKSGVQPYAVAAMNHGIVVGHVSRSISAICLIFLKSNIAGTRQYSFDLPQGGLELPYKLKFSAVRSQKYENS